MYVSTKQCHETADLANEFLGIHGACKFKSHWNAESKPLCLVTLLLYLSNLALALVSDSFGYILIHVTLLELMLIRFGRFCVYVAVSDVNW